jgi:hypothetical protein
LLYCFCTSGDWHVPLFLFFVGSKLISYSITKLK